MKSFVDDVSKNIVDSVTKDLKESGESGGSGRASADSLMGAIAKAMGKLIGQRAEKLVGPSKAMSETQTGTDTASHRIASHRIASHRSKRRPRKCRSTTSTTRPSARFTTASR